MGFDDGLGEVEPETGALGHARRLAGAVEAVEDPRGVLQWNAYLSGPGSNDYGTAVAVDANETVSVAGYGTAAWGNPIRPFSVFPDAFVAVIATTWRSTEHNLGDGWAPLSAHLGVPVPDQPYPTRNSAEEFVKAAKR